GNVILNGIDQLDVTHGVGRLFKQTGNTFIAFSAQANGPIDGGIPANLAFPLRADLGEIVAPDVRGAAAVGAVNHYDILGRKLDARVSAGNSSIIPLSDLAKKNSGQRVGGKLQFRGNARGIVARDGSSQNGGEVQDFKTSLFELFVRHGAIGSAEIYRLI